jgi:hypothetical protein
MTTIFTVCRPDSDVYTNERTRKTRFSLAGWRRFDLRFNHRCMYKSESNSLSPDSAAWYYVWVYVLPCTYVYSNPSKGRSNCRSWRVIAWEHTPNDKFYYTETHIGDVSTTKSNDHFRPRFICELRFVNPARTSPGAGWHELPVSPGRTFEWPTPCRSITIPI